METGAADPTPSNGPGHRRDLGPAGALFDRLTAIGFPEDIERGSAMLDAAGATDGLAVVPPTEARVRAFLERVPRLVPVTGNVPLAMRPPTLVELGAACVMAGCSPGAWPVVTAALEALTSPSFNLLGVQTTTSRVAPLLVVSGPAGAQCGLSSGANGPTSPGNLAVGRAVRLTLHLLGNWLPGVDNLSTVGNPAKIAWTMAESEHSPWPPARLPAIAGIPSVVTPSVVAPSVVTPSVVTAVATVGSLEVVLGQATTEVDLAILGRACDAVRSGGLTGEVSRDQAVVVISPETADRFAAAGLDRAGVASEVLGRSTVPSAPDRSAEVLVFVSGGIGIKGAVIQTWGSGAAVSAAIPTEVD